MPISRRYLLILIILIGAFFRAYGITDHWKTHDHYNYAAKNVGQMLCFKETPLSETKGIPFWGCEKPIESEKGFYRNHPTGYIYATLAWVKLLGTSEWAFRFNTFLFSVLNIWLVYLIAQFVWPTSSRSLYAAFFQATFLGPIYFGTHVDIPSEMNVSFILLATLFALRGRWTLSCLITLLSLCFEWNGLFFFAPLFLFAYLTNGPSKKIIGWGIAGAFATAAIILFLQSTWNVWAFIESRMNPNTYLGKNNHSVNYWLIPFDFVKTFLTSHARLLSPLFASFAFWELTRGKAKALWSFKKGSLEIYHYALILTGGVGLITSIVGFQYVIVHAFWFMLWMPAFALLCANFLGDLIEREFKLDRAFVIICIVLLARYPFGIYKTNAIHDGINSAVFVLTALAFLFSQKFRGNSKAIATLCGAVALANFSQTVNYRNEPDTEYAFCEQAKAVYGATGQPVRTKELPSLAKEFVYCRKIPIVYENQ